MGGAGLFGGVMNHEPRFAQLPTIAFLLLLALFQTPPLLAQIETGGVTGTVMDSSGAALAGAQVTLTNTQTGVVQTTQSTSAGSYSFGNVPVGNYTLRAAHIGFQDVLIKGIDVHIQLVLTEDAKLAVGSTAEQVTVTSAAPLLQAENASIGTTIEGKSIVDLPLNGRDWASLAQLAAGVTTASTQFSGAPGSAYFTVDGMNPWMQDFRLDGIDDNVELYGGPGPTNSNVNITPPPDAIQEFRMQNGNFNAEFGHSSAGVINAVVRSGTNRIHGDLWEFLRNNSMDANDYFSNLYGSPKAPYHLNQFGGTVGGPVIIPKLYNGKNKTFFFFDYQGTRIVQATQNISNVPTALEQSSNFSNLSDLITASGSQTKTDALGRIFPYGAILDPATTRTVAAGAIDPVSGIPNTSGDVAYVRDPFFNGSSVAGITDFTTRAASLNQLPAGRIDPNAIKLLQLYPAATSSGINNNYFENAKTPNNINQFDVRIDETYGDRDTLFGVFDWSHYVSNVPNRLPGIADGGNYSTGTIRIPVYGIALGETHVFTPSLTNDFHIGYNRNVSNQLSSSAGQLGIPAQFGIQGIPQTVDNGGLPNFNFNGSLTTLGPAEYMPNLGTITSLEFMDNVTKEYGRHTFKAGIQFDRLYGIVTSTCCSRGGLSFSGQYTDVVNFNSGLLGFADMLITPTTATVANGISNLGGVSSFQNSNFAPNRDLRYYAGLYFQDDWKVTSNLTVNLGLRWDHYTPYAEIDGRQANFVQSGAGNGDTGTFYIPNQGCGVQRAAAFDSLLLSSNIAIVCTSNKATGNSQNMNFAPRIGFADRLTQRFVVRGGYGIAYGALSNIGFGGNIGNNYPFLYTNSFNSPNAFTPFIDPAGSVPVLETALASVNVLDPAQVTPSGLNLIGRQYNYHTPYTQTYNLTVQDQFTPNDSIQVGYVGVLGRQLDSFASHNSPSQILPVGSNIYDYIPFPSFAPNAFYEVTNGTSSYNALQATFQHQTRYGLNLLANYTLSKCMTDQAFYATTFQSYRALWLPGFGAAGDYTLCDSDSTHVVHVSGEYQLPIGREGTYLKNVNRLTDALIGGWAFNYIYTFQGAEPFPINCATPTTADFGCVADILPNANLYAGGKKQQEWLNPDAIVNPPQATAVGQTDYSPLGGNPMVARGPHFNNLDASLFKQFSIEHVGHLEFRAEAFNLTNTPQFGQPGNTSAFVNPGDNNANGFSAITSLRNTPRLLQLALKLYY
jgi:Carboxypeptidase regulatory-like domain